MTQAAQIPAQAREIRIDPGLLTRAMREDMGAAMYEAAMRWKLARISQDVAKTAPERENTPR